MQVQFVVSAVITLLFSSTWLYPLLMFLGGLSTIIENRVRVYWEKRIKAQKGELLKENDNSDEQNVRVEANQEIEYHHPIENKRITGIVLAVIFVILTILAFLSTLFITFKPLLWFLLFFKLGALIFGGGQVVIPLILTGELIIVDIKTKS